MLTLGAGEMAVIFILALVLFGPKKLPELGRTIGKAMTEFRRASNDLKSTFDREMQSLERENESIKKSTREMAREIYDHATYEIPPPAESTWNPLDHPDTTTATESSTVGASEMLSAESTETPAAAPETTGVATAVLEPPPAERAAIEGTVPRTGDRES